MWSNIVRKGRSRSGLGQVQTYSEPDLLLKEEEDTDHLCRKWQEEAADECM